MLEAECRLFEWQTLGASVHKVPHIFMIFTSRNSIKFSRGRAKKQSPVPGMGKGKVIILKSTHSFFITKDTHQVKQLYQSLLQPARWEIIQLWRPLTCLSHLRERERKNYETLVKVTGWGHRHAKRLET